ncbi:hypothetical protein D6D25_05445 [Aureobasidium pullulans]|nr:hypothetical protein D6D25_05445 [Aureobasidium pullulans]
MSEQQFEDIIAIFRKSLDVSETLTQEERHKVESGVRLNKYQNSYAILMCALRSNDIKVNDHKSPSATPKIALLLPQKPPVPQKPLQKSQKRKYQQNLEFPQKQEAQQRSQIRQLPPILQPHAAGVKGPTDASNSPSFINPAKVIKPDNAQQERFSRFSEEQNRTLELRSERIFGKLKLKTFTELITLQMNNPEGYVPHLIGDVIFKKRMNALDTLESQL